MDTSNCKHCSKEDYESIMTHCVRCELQNEVKECKTCKTNNNKLKKANNIFPDAIVDLINSFNACKRCIKTIDLIKNEPETLKTQELNLWYFVNLNPLPSIRFLNSRLSDNYRLTGKVRGSLCWGDFNFYFYYQEWFNELWKPTTVKILKGATMICILRIMFNIDGNSKYKLEYPKIFNEEFYRDNVHSYLRNNNTVLPSR